MTRTKGDEARIGKFDILATYTYAKGLLEGLDDAEARERGMVAAVMGAKARLGRRGGSPPDDYRADKQAAEKKHKSTITAESFDRQVADKMGDFFGDVFLPALKELAAAGLSYDEVKRLVKIPPAWGAKIGGGAFRERVAKRPGRR